MPPKGSVLADTTGLSGAYSTAIWPFAKRGRSPLRSRHAKVLSRDPSLRSERHQGNWPCRCRPAEHGRCASARETTMVRAASRDWAPHRRCRRPFGHASRPSVVGRGVAVRHSPRPRRSDRVAIRTGTCLDRRSGVDPPGGFGQPSGQSEPEKKGSRPGIGALSSSESGPQCRCARPPSNSVATKHGTTGSSCLSRRQIAA